MKYISFMLNESCFANPTFGTLNVCLVHLTGRRRTQVLKESTNIFSCFCVCFILFCFCLALTMVYFGIL